MGVSLLKSADVAHPQIVDPQIFACWHEPNRMIEAAVSEDTAMDGALGANRFRPLQFPRSCRKAIVQVRECTDRTNVNHIARKDVVKFLTFSDSDVTPPAPLYLLKLLFADNFVAESDAPLAHDAAFSVKGDVLADSDWLYESSLLLGEAGVRSPLHECGVLKWAFAASVANGAIKWVVDEQELHDGASGCFRRFTLDLDDHAVADGHGARRLRLGHPLDDWIALFVSGDGAVRVTTGQTNFNETLPTDADRLKAWMVAKMRYVNAKHFRRLNDECPFGHFNDLTVNGHTNLFGIRRNFTPSQPNCCASQDVRGNFFFQWHFAPKHLDEFVPSYVARHAFHLASFVTDEFACIYLKAS